MVTIGELIVLIIGITALAIGAKNWHNYNKMARMPISDIQNLKVGETVKIFGKAVSEKVLKAPFSGTECVYYNCSIYEIAWRLIYRFVKKDENESSANFFIVNGKDKIEVNPKNAEINVKKIVLTTENSEDLTSNIAEYEKKLGICVKEDISKTIVRTFIRLASSILILLILAGTANMTLNAKDVGTLLLGLLFFLIFVYYIYDNIVRHILRYRFRVDRPWRVYWEYSIPQNEQVIVIGEIHKKSGNRAPDCLVIEYVKNGIFYVLKSEKELETEKTKNMLIATVGICLIILILMFI